MESDTDRLRQLHDNSGEFVETIVLEGTDIMTTTEFRKLMDPDFEPSRIDDSHPDHHSGSYGPTAMSDAPDAVKICRVHDSPMFRLVRNVMIGGKLRPAGFEFCRYCTDGLVRCPNCGFAASVISFMLAGVLESDGSIRDKLTCIKTSCETCLATTGTRGGNV